MKYCQRCILPDTRPGLTLDSEGICSACRNFELRSEIDWLAREKSFEAVIENAKQKSRGYDCLIPVSGGKDSTWQTVTCLEKGLNPLCVTWKTPARTMIGQQNLENLVSLGVDHIDYQINPEVEKTFMLTALKKYGSTAIPMHMALFNIPLKIASKFEIPLIIWGENSAFEYGGGEDERLGFRLDSNWLKNYGVTHGTTAEDWVDQPLSRKELTPYFGPDPNELEASGISAVFLGYYYSWDVQMTYEIAKKHGFRASTDGTRTGIYDFADIDDDFISIHHYIKWFKFGFPRTFDNLSLEIRHGRITRDDGIELARKYGEDCPQADIEKFCEFVSISAEEFLTIVERFRNRDIWFRDGGQWKIRDFLISDWNW